MSNVSQSYRLIEEVWNKRNFSVIDELLSPDFVAHDPFAGDQQGPASQHTFVQGMLNAFPDVKAEILSQEDWDDKVTTLVLYTGTQTGSLYSPTGDELPASGNVAEVLVEVTDRYDENGKIVESWAEWEPQEMLAQLGYA